MDPWLSPEIAEAIRDRRRALQRHKRRPSLENLIAFRRLRARARQLIDQQKQECWERGLAGRGRGRGTVTGTGAGAGRGRGTYLSSGPKFRGSRGARPWATRGRRFVDTPFTKKNKPKEQKQVPKEQKQVPKTENQEDGGEDVALYKQKLTITPDPERKFVDNEIDKIKEALLDALEPLEDGYFPQFYGHSFGKGVLGKGMLVMSCANEQTKQWLERIVPQLKPWEGAKLRIKPKGEVTQGSKVQLKTPKLFAKTDPKKILQMLSTQNKTLNTSTWKNVSVKSEASGQTLVYLVDNQSVEAIRALDKVYLGLGNVELVVLDNEEDGKQTSVDTDMKDEEEDDKQASADTDVKIKEEPDKEMSVDTEMKNEEEADKQTS